MQTKEKANSVITCEPKGENVLFKVKGAGEFLLRVGAISQKNRDRAMVHGLVQRVSDGAAKARDKKTGASATPQDKYDAMFRLADHLMSGSEEWSPARVGGARKVAGPDPVILAAAAEALGKTPDEIAALVTAGAGKRGISEVDFVVALGQAKAIEPIVARMRAEAVTEDPEDLLADMIAEEGEELGSADEPGDAATF